MAVFAGEEIAKDEEGIKSRKVKGKRQKIFAAKTQSREGKRGRKAASLSGI